MKILTFYDFIFKIEHLNKFKIYSIISGHQDQIPLGFLANDNDNDKFIYENNYKYNLYHLKDNNNKKLNPTNDFKALVTSNRITGDPNAKAIYLILSQINIKQVEQEEKDAVAEEKVETYKEENKINNSKGGNIFFYKKYLKYKKKYLMLKN